MPDSKLELLIRKPGPEGNGFNIVEVGSGLVYAGYRPVRLEAGLYEAVCEDSPVGGMKFYTLKAEGSQKYLVLSSREFYLFELMDGSRSIKDIASEYFFHFGGLDLGAIKKLLGRLREAGLVEFVPASRLRVAAGRSSNPVSKFIKKLLDRLEYRIDDADGWVTRFYEKGGYVLVSKYAMLFYVVLSAMGLFAFGRFEGIGKFPYGLFVEHPFLSAGGVILSFYPIAAVHELFHALACKRCGRKVYAFGITLWDGFYPSFYTDVSDIFMSPRRQRIYVSIAGPISTTALAALLLFPVAAHPEASWAEPLYQMGRLYLLVALISFYPFQFIKMDGYYLLSDLLGFPGLRDRTFAFIRKLPEHVSAGKSFTRTELIMAAYFMLSTLSIVLFLAYFFA